MNQPTRQEFDQLKEEVRRLREQQTEPIKITRLEIDTGTMREEMEGARADISNIKATQSDHSAFFIEHGQRLSAIETKQDTHTELLGQLINVGEDHTKSFTDIKERLNTTATKDDISRLETIMMQILDRLPQPGGE
jgi:Tfp pilus assembly protein PilN